MEKQILPGLRNTFLIHVIVGVIFGLTYLLAAEWFVGMVGMPATTASAYRVIGAAILGFTASSWWAYHETEWARVRIVTEMEIVWTVLGALATLWGILFSGLPALAWLNVILLALFALAFGYYYMQEGAMVSRTQAR